MNGEELEFILRMRDEATAILDKVGGGLGKAGKGAKGFSDENKKVSRSLGDVVKQAKAATAALGGMYGSMRMLRSATNAWSDYQLGLVGVVKTTGMAGRELDVFRGKFDQLDRTMKGISTQQIHALSETVGQLGVTGSDNIVAMTEVLAKLGVTTDIVGQEGASSVARILTLTGEGAKGVREFGDALNYLGNNSAASESEILRMATVLAQSTAEFGISGKNILALSAGARQLGVSFELFGTSSGRVLRNLRDGMMANTTGFRTFLSVAGMTREEFQKLLAEKPEQVIVRFAQAYAQMTGSGGSAGFLQALGLNTDEIKRVFGAIGVQVEAMQEKLNLVQSDEMYGALDREAEQFFAAQANQLDGMAKAWKSFNASVGEALAPLTGPVIEGVTQALYGLSDAISGLPAGIKQVAAAGIVLAPAIGGIAAAFKVLKPLLVSVGMWKTASGGVGILAKAVGGLKGAVSLAGRVISRTWPVLVGLLAGEAARAGGDWIAEWAERNLGETTLSKLAAFRKEYEGFFDFMAQDLVTGVIQSGPNAGINYRTGQREYEQNDKGEWVKYTPKVELQPDWGDGIGSTLRDRVQDEVDAAGPVRIPVTEEDYDALKALNSQIGLLEDIRAQEEALNRIRESGMDMLRNHNDALSEQDVERAQRLLDLKKEAAADPVGWSLRDLDSEIDAARAVTSEQKHQLAIREKVREIVEQTGESEERVLGRVTAKMNELRDAQSKMNFNDMIRDYNSDIEAARAVTVEARMELEVREAIRDLQEEGKKLDEEQVAAIRGKVQELYKVQQANAFEDQMRAARSSLDIARATTEAERERLQIKQQIDAFERQHGKLAPEDRQQLAAALAAKNQAEAFGQLRSTLDPVGEATRQYEQNVQTLNQALADGSITAQQYQDMLNRLNVTTQDARDPFGAQIRSMQEALQVARMTGDYRDADVKTLQTINRLQEQGVTLSQTQKDQIAAMNRELQDIEKARGSGLQGWASGIGSLKDNLMDLTKDFASGLSDALVGVFTGQKGAITGLLRNLATGMVRLGVNQIMKNMVQSFQGGGGASGMGKGGIGGFFSRLFGRGDQEQSPAKDAASTVQDAVQQMTAANMTVTAGTVMINGSPVGMPGVGGPTTGSISQRGGMIFDELMPSGGAANSNLAGLGSQINSAVAQSASSAVDNATKFLGMSEHTNASQLNSFMKSQGVDIDAAKTAWCAAFVNTNLEAVGVDGTGSLVANSFLKWGDGVNPQDVLKGDVLVQHRNKGYGNTGGHVGFATGNTKMSEQGLLLEMLSGNEKDRVQKSWKLADQVAVRRASAEMGNAPLDAMSTASVPEVSQLTNQWQQQMATANANIAQQMPQAFQAPMQNVGQQFDQVFAQGGSAFQQVAPQMQNIAQQAQSVVPQLGGVGQGLTSLMGPLGQMVPGLNDFQNGLQDALKSILGSGGGGGGGGGIQSIMNQLMGSLGGGGGGGMFGGIFSIFKLLLGGLFHKGGVVGDGMPASGMRALPASAWNNAPRFHKGLKSNEYTAILERGERVLTANDDRRNINLIEGLSERLDAQSRQRAQNDRSRFGNGSQYNQNITVYAEDANSFRRSEGQLMADSSVQLRRLGGRNS
ncbi:phage tail tape measure protein [Nitratireductor sp. OM-1]|uniref:phage tail tape measure protein n=1 Tax=Nitratireductor sp. OM-1 TaxID=1756988 RepID=UPI000DDE0265|nr:phage tail tape measure protein [Nitratireductor sp. OM-1]